MKNLIAVAILIICLNFAAFAQRDEQQVLKMSPGYAQIVKDQDVAAIEKVLADEHLYTDEKGKTKNKTENLASYKTRETKLELLEVSDQTDLFLSRSSLPKLVL